MKGLLMAVSVAVAMLVAGGCSEKPSLHIYTWADYISPTVIERFEEKYGCKVVVDTFDTNEAMYAKLKAGGAGYDLLFPSSYIVGLLVKEGLVEALDHTKCPSVRKNFYKPYAKMLPEDPELVYGAPYSSSQEIIFYDTKRIPDGVEVGTWAIFGNPAFKGKVSFLDDMRDVIGVGLMYLGYSINSTSQKEIDEAVEQVLKWRENARKFDSESYKTEVANGSTWISQGYSQVAYQVIFGDADGSGARPDLACVYPKEGFTESCEEMVVAKDAPNRDLAYALIEFLYSDVEAGVANMKYVFGILPCKPAINALDDKFRDMLLMKPEIMARAQVILGLESKPEVMEMYAKAWDRIRAVK